MSMANNEQNTRQQQALFWLTYRERYPTLSVMLKR